MLFNSLEFLIFFPCVICVYFLLPNKLKRFWLLLSSYFFYMCWNAPYALLLLFSTTVTYISGILLEQVKRSGRESSQKKKTKNLIVAFSFLINLGILCYFKYINFLIDSAASLLSLFRISLHIPRFDVVLPVGISFYVFQALSYTMDVYRDEIPAEYSFTKYALFVSFFPQLVAGPIEKSKNLLWQLDQPHPFDFDNARDGLLLMLWGLFLKIVLADRIALFVDTVYGDIGAYPGIFLLVATVLFAVQIYCDFSGYSIVALGAAQVLGIHLTENFSAPYYALSVGEFWRKWHISLTSWFKDYLYIPLGGSRRGVRRKYINKMIVFLVSGLWHGAQFSFVIWGCLNGLYQVLEELTQPLRNRAVSVLRLNRNSLGHKGAQMLITFVLIDFSWIFFRAGTFSEAVEIINSMLTVRNPWILFDGSLYTCGLDRSNFTLMVLCIGVLCFADFCKTRGIAIRRIILRQDYWFRWVFIAVSILLILTFGKYGPTYEAKNFIYFQF